MNISQVRHMLSPALLAAGAIGVFAVAMCAQVHTVAFGEPGRSCRNRSVDDAMSIRATGNQAARSVLWMIEARQEPPRAPQRVDLAIVQNDPGQVGAQKIPQFLAGLDRRGCKVVRRPVRG